jgi:ribosomal protein L11 methyltransferase
VWVLSRRPVRVGRFVIAPPAATASPGAVILSAGPAFGTGLHPTTALCLEALDQRLNVAAPSRMLDVGTGSGILALAALRAGVPRAAGLDIDPAALHAAATNARLNGCADRLDLICGGPDAIRGAWPLVIANLTAALLIDIASSLPRRVARGGQLILSGVAAALTDDVARAYRHVGMRLDRRQTRQGWSALVLQATW